MNQHIAVSPEATSSPIELGRLGLQACTLGLTSPNRNAAWIGS